MRRLHSGAPGNMGSRPVWFFELRGTLAAHGSVNAQKLVWTWDQFAATSSYKATGPTIEIYDVFGFSAQFGARVVAEWFVDAGRWIVMQQGDGIPECDFNLTSDLAIGSSAVAFVTRSGTGTPVGTVITVNDTKQMFFGVVGTLGWAIWDPLLSIWVINQLQCEPTGSPTPPPPPPPPTPPPSGSACTFCGPGMLVTIPPPSGGTCFNVSNLSLSYAGRTVGANGDQDCSWSFNNYPFGGELYSLVMIIRFRASDATYLHELIVTGPNYQHVWLGTRNGNPPCLGSIAHNGAGTPACGTYGNASFGGMI